MSDSPQLILGLSLGALICVSLIGWQVSRHKEAQANKNMLQLHVACLNGGGVWDGLQCHRPPSTKD